MKVSIIVAAYNAEKYVAETMNSLINQTIDDYEIIVVNDGSSDSTLDILREYEKAHSHVQVIDKENGGPSSARNKGLDIAKGEYVYFFDADDILEADALEALYKTARKKHADLVIAKYDIFNRYKIFPVNGINSLVEEKRIKKYDPRILWTFSLCNKLFRREIIETYSLRLPPISYSEDGAFLMNYIYHSKRITGLDKVIFHYRRMYDGVAESITASISPSKIRDYIEAHRLIFAAAEESLLKDFPQYSSMEEIMEKEEEIHKYLNEISRKELSILLDQFYTKFWEIGEETVALVVEEIQDKLKTLDMRDISLLQDGHPEYSLFHLPMTASEVLKQSHFTVMLYGTEAVREDFINSLASLLLQNLVTITVMVPSSMREAIEEEDMLHDNIVFVDVDSERELFYYGIANADTPYITFANPKIAYVNNAFKYALKSFIKSPGDFLVELIYHRNYGDIQGVLLNRMTLNSLKAGYEKDNPFLAMDYTLANKFFRVEFLRSQDLDENTDLLEYLPMFYARGYYPFMNDGVVLYEAPEETFIDFIGKPDTIPFMKEYLKEQPADLTSPEIVRDLNEVLSKMTKYPTDTPIGWFSKKVISLLRKCKVKDQVLFFSIRKDGELEGNAKALYPFVKGKKVICAKMLPHNIFREWLMFYRIYTSKVIVTDDYVRYIRNFQLRESQRVIQLWHACGAFKKFGQHGTNMSIHLDNATHAQYNMVTVSSENIRSIYADAFNIDIHKVKALGCPRTDYFYDEKWIQERKEKIYEAYPQFREKSVIIYAPTFRDVNEERSEFNPDLDFAQLSKSLLPNQMLIICPHPVMKNAIVDGDYENIKVIRDFSTNDLMHISDMLITDYSSVIFEYALLRKPIVFFCYDLANYNRGFYLNYPDDLPGDVFETQEDLTNYLTAAEQHVVTEKHERFIERYMSACDGHSCERIAALINSYMEGSENAGK